jgi:transcriptional regulator with XRE-family HTH domain
MTRPPQWPSGTELRRRFGANFREARQQAGLTQAQVAERIGGGRAYVGRVERGAHNITIETMAELARAVERDVADLLRPKKNRSGG